MTKRFANIKLVSLLTAISSILFLTQACTPVENVPPTTNSNANVSVPTNANTNVNSAPKTEAKTVAPDQAVTLPVLNAMFAEENFAQQLKDQVQLSDEQIEKLKTASEESVANLDENANTDAEQRSTRAALEDSIRKVGAIVGDEKSAKFFEYVKQHSAEQTAQTNDQKPGQIPSDTRVVVNAPAYRMDLFQDGKLVKSYKVGIGYPEFPLPQGLRKANTIIFNPTWTPPDEPWVKGKVRPGKKVEAGSKLNPLGPIKIPIGSPSLIHGGKVPARLGTFASHGCVGLTNALVQDFSVELAKISGTNLTLQDVREYEKKKTETKNLPLKAPVQVELRYETIVATADGKLTIYRDVYEKGTNTEENLRKVLDANGVSFDQLPPDLKTQILDGLNQMAYNAKGKKVEADANTNSNKNKNSNSATVTKTLKGKSQIAFDIAELKGKGYPVAVNINK